MPLKNPFIVALLISLLSLSACGGGGGGGGSGGANNNQSLASKTRALGRKIFFDEDLSSNANQSCGSCHDPLLGFADSAPDVTAAAPVSEGSVSGQFGNRNAPTAAYASLIPPFVKLTTTTVDLTDSNYQGGQFLDGRRSTLAEQAKDPFLNPVEMNNVDKADVVSKVQNSSYADDFKEVFGANAFTDVDQAYDNIADAIAAFETSSEMNPFTSKFDAIMAGRPGVSFNASEQRGFDLFTGTVAKCGNCHTVNSPDASGSLFTDFNYFNIGTPANPDNPIYDPLFGNDPTFIDEGLAGNANVPLAEKAAEQGKFRTPTLRNVELTAPYMHNGAHETLNEVITHYDLFSDGNISPEVNANIAEELRPGLFQPLGLSVQDSTDLENFMLTLTDGYF
ncbi:MAG: cytochrome-c peroxidase [Gammaproteobacteria bacterium]|nr:cytochrome-c peroxidase [Gammaproteobacteria bacterium]